jgi:hypothetical protein
MYDLFCGCFDDHLNSAVRLLELLLIKLYKEVLLKEGIKSIKLSNEEEIIIGEKWIGLWEHQYVSSLK